jgi:hypothetical protein
MTIVDTLECARLGVRVILSLTDDPSPTREKMTALIQIKDDERGWLDFYRMVADDLADGDISIDTLGKDPLDAKRMLRAIALAADARARTLLSNKIKKALRP